MVFGPMMRRDVPLIEKEIGMSWIFRLFCVSVAVASTLTTAAMAQWSIGQPGSREPPPGLNRYVYRVMSDPLPGREFDFNDGYQNMHMGDLVQLPGWTGAQRFRLVSDVVPRNIKPLYRRGNRIIWDQEGLFANLRPAICYPALADASKGWRTGWSNKAGRFILPLRPAASV
jgi:hypothetical protein